MKKGDVVRFTESAKINGIYSSYNEEYVIEDITNVAIGVGNSTKMVKLEGIDCSVDFIWLEFVKTAKEIELEKMINKNCKSCSGFLKNKYGMSECKFCIFPLHDCITKGFSEHQE